MLINTALPQFRGQRCLQGWEGRQMIKAALCQCNTGSVLLYRGACIATSGGCFHQFSESAVKVWMPVRNPFFKMFCCLLFKIWDYSSASLHGIALAVKHALIKFVFKGSDLFLGPIHNFSCSFFFERNNKYSRHCSFAQNLYGNVRKVLLQTGQTLICILNGQYISPSNSVKLGLYQNAFAHRWSFLLSQTDWCLLCTEVLKSPNTESRFLTEKVWGSLCVAFCADLALA